jgi:hypothetical protein
MPASAQGFHQHGLNNELDVCLRRTVGKPVIFEHGWRRRKNGAPYYRMAYRLTVQGRRSELWLSKMLQMVKIVRKQKWQDKGVQTKAAGLASVPVSSISGSTRDTGSSQEMRPQSQRVQ